jgi:hydrogenase expression/formation protein HypD
MKSQDIYRDPTLARGLAAAIAREAQGRAYRFMEFCGGHTHALSRFGLEDLLPPTVHMIHGPGCPVCVLPIGRLDMAIALARRPGLILATYGDMMRVPGSNGESLLKAKAQGGDVRMVYSPLQAVDMAKRHPDRDVVFFAVGFETTTPPTAVALRAARAAGLSNFSVFCNHVLTPAAIGAIMDAPHPPQLDGFVGPGHVTTMIGADAYAPAAALYQKPIVIAGFEPIDLLDGILRLVRQVNAGRAVVENAFARASPMSANARAAALTSETMTLRERFAWRGLGVIANSALRIADAYADMDAERRFALVERDVADHKACECGTILRGEKRPAECRVFAGACTPDTPLGACMVSPEGACAAHYLYGRFRTKAEASA